MMTTLKFTIYFTVIVLFSIFNSINVEAQRCRGYDSKCDNPPNYFESSSLSRSTSIRRGRKVVFNQTFYGNREYYVSVCGHRRLGELHFRLIADNEDETVLYDNATDDFSNTRLFVIQSTMQIKIEVSAPHYFDERNSECAGIRISYHQSGEGNN
ncbi:hypothetical protein QA597_09440 [Marinilabiliaceae bacterium ANBcel2]|nr:hypothetical protein [Marinilabiliaceae bacterium ANBcel2]